jgi:hypothetical protein
MMNPGPPGPRAFLQARSGDRPWPGDAAWRSQIPRQREPAEPVADADEPEPTLVLDIDMHEPLPAISGGVVTRAWLLLRVGSAGVGELFIAVPPGGLTPGEIGAAIAARIGARRRRPRRRAEDGQARSRRRGSTSSL